MLIINRRFGFALAAMVLLALVMVLAVGEIGLSTAGELAVFVGTVIVGVAFTVWFTRRGQRSDRRTPGNRG
jgi:hypothetical protein